VGNFLNDTAAQKLGGDTYRVELSRDWEIWGPNGGYSSAVLLRAVGMQTDKQRPISFAAQYLQVPDFGEATVAIECVKDGKSASAYQARLIQSDKIMLQALIWAGNSGSGPEHQLTSRPGCYVPLSDAGDRPPVGPFRFWDRLEIRQVKNSEGYYSHWYRFDPDFELSDPFVEGARSLVLVDSMPWPARYFMEDKPPMYVAPSLDLYVQFHQFNRGSRWLFCDAESTTARAGVIAGHATVWDEDGQLLASGGGQSVLRRVDKPY